MSQNKGRNSHQKRALKVKLFEIHGKECYYCERELDMQSGTLEHLTPLSLGGTWSILNLRLACATCNFKRGNTSSHKFKNKIRKRVKTYA